MMNNSMMSQKYFILILRTLVLICALGFASNAWAEFRAYELEVFDIIQNKSEIVITSFSPDDYVMSHGGPQRIGVITRSTWMCFGDTSGFKVICPQPEIKDGKFQKGDKVQVILKKHITESWVGVVENSYFNAELSINVYGVRFAERKNLYNRYYEPDLQKAP